MSDYTLYWTAVFVIVMMAVVTMYVQRKHKHTIELFTTNIQQPAVIPADYNEVTARNSRFNERFPQVSSLFLYVSAFSRITGRDNMSRPVYASDTLRWLDMINRNDFAIQTTGNAPPQLIIANTVVGLPLDNVKLLNTSASEQFGMDPANKVYTLGMFSAVFYMNWDDITDIQGDVSLLEMFAETPNHLAWTLTNITPSSLQMEVTLGDKDTSYVWIVPTSTFMSNGNATLYTLVYDAPGKIISVYIGLNEYRKEIDQTPQIKLSNSQLVINDNKNAKATLKAFAFFKNARLTLSDVIKLNEYFATESGGMTAIMGETQDRIRELENENQNLRGLVERQQQNVDAADEAIQAAKECVAEKENSRVTTKLRKKQVTTDFPAPDVSPDDLKQCSALDIRDFKEAKEDSILEKQLKDAKYLIRTPSDRPLTPQEQRDLLTSIQQSAKQQADPKITTPALSTTAKSPITPTPSPVAPPPVEEQSLFDFIRTYLV